MKMALARYARQDLYAWGDRPVGEILSWYKTLCELVAEEGSVRSIMEE